MGEDKQLGKLLREKRLEHGWSAETAGVLYGNAVRGMPVTEGAIYTLEEGRLPRSVKRRWVLARMYHLVPAAIGLSEVSQNQGRIPTVASRKPKPIDAEEYQATLTTYWKQGYAGNAEGALKDLGYRIHMLHDTIFYVSSPQKAQLKRLLCAYHMRRAEVARELGYSAGALEHLNKAVLLAKEEGYHDFAATALYRRGEHFFDAMNYEGALRDLKQAQELEHSAPAGNAPYSIPSQVKGRILSVHGLAEARVAVTEGERKDAMSLMDESEHFIRSDGAVEELYTLDFSSVRYLLNRAKALVGPPLKTLHAPNAAFDIINEMIKLSDPNLKRLHTYHIMDSNIIQSIAYLDLGYYPIATTLAQIALQMMEETSSLIHLPILAQIYEELQESSYGKSVEVAELGLNLLRLQYPQVFVE